MRLYHLYQIDAFTKEKLTGNPAGVITNADGLTDVQMQKIARELNNSETAFIFSPVDDTHDVHVRFFTPQNEVPICGHATVAAHYALAREKHLGNTRVYQKTGAGILPVDIIREESDYKIVMTQGKITIGEALQKESLEMMFSAFGIERQNLREDCPVCIASTGHSKVMVGIRDHKQLHRLRPNMELLTKVSRLIGCNGFYVFTVHPEETVLVHGRMFAPAIGIPEDPVTGNANGPLGAYFAHFKLFGSADKKEFSFTAMQGEAIKRTGTMDVHVTLEEGRPVSVRIAGYAVIAFSTELSL
jgi:PhzF family phenazine biosynthesis protein